MVDVLDVLACSDVIDVFGRAHAIGPILDGGNQPYRDPTVSGEEKLRPATNQDDVAVERNQTHDLAEMVEVRVEVDDLVRHKFAEDVAHPVRLGVVEQVEHRPIEFKGLGDQIDDFTSEHRPPEGLAETLRENAGAGARRPRYRNVGTEVVIRLRQGLLLPEGLFDSVFDPVPLESVAGQPLNDFFSCSMTHDVLP
jgi:hypothetical protein